LDDRVKVLEEIADDPTAAASDRIGAVDVLAKYGLGAATELTVDQVRERCRSPSREHHSRWCSSEDRPGGRPGIRRF
jgi:hypothetical protein